MNGKLIGSIIGLLVVYDGIIVLFIAIEHAVYYK